MKEGCGGGYKDSVRTAQFPAAARQRGGSGLLLWSDVGTINPPPPSTAASISLEA